MHQALIKIHFVIIPIITLLFFNPRSSKWEPIIEAFKASIDYQTVEGQNGTNMNFIV